MINAMREQGGVEKKHLVPLRGCKKGLRRNNTKKEIQGRQSRVEVVEGVLDRHNM